MGCLTELMATTETGEIPVKHPLEERLYGVDFSNDLAAGEVVSAVGDVTITAEPTDLTFSGEVLAGDGMSMNFFIGGGSHNPGYTREYLITFVFETNMLQTKVIVGQLIVGTP